MSDSLQPHGLQPTRLLHPWDFPGKSTGVDCYFCLLEISPAQELNLGLPHCRQTLYHLSHQGSLGTAKCTAKGKCLYICMYACMHVCVATHGSVTQLYPTLCDPMDCSPWKRESSRKISTSALLTTPKSLTVWVTTNWKILKEMGILDHLTCLLKNLYAGQEVTVRTGH